MDYKAKSSGKIVTKKDIFIANQDIVADQALKVMELMTELFRTIGRNTPNQGKVVDSAILTKLAIGCADLSNLLSMYAGIQDALEKFTPVESMETIPNAKIEQEEALPLPPLPSDPNKIN